MILLFAETSLPTLSHFFESGFHFIASFGTSTDDAIQFVSTSHELRIGIISPENGCPVKIGSVIESQI